MLTDSQREDLNLAIYEYLNKNFEKTAECFRGECSDDVTQGTSMKDALERKWISIIRLTKKIGELESTIENLSSELKNVSKMKKTTANAAETETLFPKFPPTHKLTGHKGMVNKVTYHPMFGMIASAGEDAMIKIWDFESGKYEFSLKGHTAPINDIKFEPNGSLLASGSSDLSIKIWDLDSKICIKTLSGHDHVVSSVRWKPAGDFLLSASRDMTIKLWEINSGFCKQTWTGHNEWVRIAVYNESATKFASASSDQSIKLWTESQKEPIMHFYGHEHVIEALMFIDGNEAKKTVTSASWNAEAKKDDDYSNMTAIELSKKRLAEGDKNEEENFDNVEFLISGSRDKKIIIWSCQTGAMLLTFASHSGWVRGLAMHHSGKYFYSCSEDKSIRTWSLKKGKAHGKIENAHNHFVQDIASHPVYLSVVSCSVDSSIHVWDCK